MAGGRTPAILVPVMATAAIRVLVLWDIDYTLIATGAGSRAAFDAAVESVVGRHPGTHDVHFFGKTDPEIALEILGAMAIIGPEAAEHLPRILRALEDQLEVAVDALRASGGVLPGVEPVLRWLAAEPAVLQTVLTGNVEANARLKLRVFGLDGWFDFECGAYGSDHADRERLVPVAVEKAERIRGARPSRVWVVGDTARDLACARAGGARCFLVATGWALLEELRAAGADAVLPDLTDTENVVRLLLDEG